MNEFFWAGFLSATLFWFSAVVIWATWHKSLEDKSEEILRKQQDAEVEAGKLESRRKQLDAKAESGNRRARHSL